MGELWRPSLGRYVNRATVDAEVTFGYRFRRRASTVGRTRCEVAGDIFL